MPFIDIWERMAMVKGLLPGIEALLRVRFGAEGLKLMPEIREIRDHEVLRKILHRIVTADSPAALRRYWTRVLRSKKAKPMWDEEDAPEAATPAPRRSGRRRS